MPIKGDVKYGARRSERMGGIRLHAARVSFHDPRTGEYRTVDAPIDAPDPLWLAFPGVESHG
jgi:23S rRNA pseudouridine1911/1915/1917 synthase